MNNIFDSINRKHIILFLAWISITLGQVIYKLADRPGELLSSLVITIVVIALLSTVVLHHTKRNATVSRQTTAG